MQKPSLPIGGEALRPQARTTNIVISELPDEELVYDLKTHQAYCLNKTAAVVWKQCDGQRQIKEITEFVKKELGCPVDEALIWLALERLGKANLLETPVATTPKLSRRVAIGMLGRGFALPLVVSIVAPLAAGAMTCTATGQPCDIFANTCCTGCCNATPTPDICSPAGGNGLALPGTPCTTNLPCCSNMCVSGQCL